MATFDPSWAVVSEWVSGVETLEGEIISAKEKVSSAGNPIHALCVKAADGRLVMGYLTFTPEAIETVFEAASAMGVDVSSGEIQADAWIGRRVRVRTQVSEGRSRSLVSVGRWMAPTG